MARKRRNKTKGGSEAPKAPEAEVAPAPEAPAEEVDLGEVQEEAGEEAPADLPTFDPVASERALLACANIFSTAKIAAAEAVNAAGPHFTFAQKSRLAGLATRFKTAVMAQGSMPAVAVPAAAATPTVVQSEGLSREEIEGIISHRLEIAVHDALANLGVSPDETITAQVEKTVESQLATQEHKLLEYVKKHLTDSLEMLEGSLDQRIAEFLEGEGEVEEQRAEVDAQVEEAREALLKNIDEVRTVETGFDMSMLDIAGIAEMTEHGGGGDAEVFAAAADNDEVELEAGDGEEVELEAGDGEEVELEAGDGDEVEAPAEDEEEAVEAETAPDEDETTPEEEPTAEEGVEVGAPAEDDDEVEIAADEIEVDAEAVELEVGGEDEEIAAPGAADAGGEVDFDSVAAEQMDDYIEVEAAADDLEIEESVADEDSVVELEDDGPIEEISIIEAVGDDDASPTEEIELQTADLIEGDGDVTEDASDDAALADALEIELEDVSEADEEDEEIGLLTLGDGPEDLQVTVVDEIVELEIPDIEESIEIEAEDDGSTDEEAIARYLQRAQEMRSRRQNVAAMELYSKVVDLDANNYEARIGRGVLSLEGKDYKRAVEEFTAAEKIDGTRPASALGLAEVHFHRKQFNKAIRHYTQCLKLDDQLAQAYCNRGLSYYYQKNYKKAFLDLMRAYDLDPGLPNIKKYLKLVRNKVKSDKSVPGSSAPKK